MKPRWTRAQEKRWQQIKLMDLVSMLHPGRPKPQESDLVWLARMKRMRSEAWLDKLFGTNRKGRKARRMWEKRRGEWLAAQELNGGRMVGKRTFTN